MASACGVDYAAAAEDVPGISRQQYAVRADGQRFLIVTKEEGSVAPITVILNWQAGGNK